MDADERQIYHYLKYRKEQFICIRDIARDVGGKRKVQFAPEWAHPVLARMSERGIVESDGKDGFRIKPILPKETNGKLWASPQFADILKKSGKDFQDRMRFEDEDAYYDKL